ncbi:MAG TPA: hypothetical protein VG860_04555 [Terriglobia bacterium]|jgi:hypothetical protein|nr:hypothetical protein [Terriglobia bacterium]
MNFDRPTSVSQRPLNASDAFASNAASGGPLPRPRRSRYPLRDSVYFSIPTELFDTGMIRNLKPTELLRYLNLLRISNFGYGCRQISASMAELEQLDGVSERAGRNAATGLDERGLVELIRGRPYSYFLLSPPSWNNRSPALVENTHAQILAIIRNLRT